MEYRYRVFLAVANNLSFSKGAEELSISQPAATTHIKELEKSLGVKLFERSGNHIILTQAGSVVYDYASSSLKLHTELIAKLNFLKYEADGSLNIGAEHIPATYILPYYLGKFCRQFPQVDLNIITGKTEDLEEKVKKRELDTAIIKNIQNLKELEYTPFINDSIVGVTGANNNTISNGPVSLSRIEKLPFIRENDDSETIKTIREILEKKGMSINSFSKQIQLNHTEAVKNAVTYSEGFALLPKSTIKKELNLNQLKIFTIENLSIEYTYRYVCHKRANNRKAELFVQFINSEKQ